MNAPELLSLVLLLRPLESAPPAAPGGPRWWGRAAHALLLDLARRADPQLAGSLHDENGRRPFSASSLLGRCQKNGLPDPHNVYVLRFTALEAQLCAVLLAAAAPGGACAPGATIELDYLPFRVEAVCSRPDQHPWAACAGYADLSAACLLGERPPARQIGLQFTSPVVFKSQERHIPVPLPELVFNSLLDRWNALAPLAFPAEARRYAAECLAISRYRLETRGVPLKNGGLRVGAVGSILYTALNYDRYWLSVLHTLAAFALFAGVGAGVSMGLGQCRPAPPPAP